MRMGPAATSVIRANSTWSANQADRLPMTPTTVAVIRARPPFSRVAAGLAALPFRHQAVKAAEQEVAGAAGGVDQARGLVAELADRRGERAVEDEFLDELGRLQQRVALAGGLRQVLVEVAEEAGVPLGVGEVVHQRPARRVHRLPELAQRHRRVAADAEAEDRVVRLIEEGLQPMQGAGLAKGGEQVVTVGFERVGAEVGFVTVTREREPAGVRGAGQPGAVDELVVLDEAHEHAGQQPVHAGLGDDLVGPALEGLGAAVGIARGLPFGTQRCVELGQLGDAGTQVVFEALELASKVGEELRGVDHERVPSKAH